MTTQYVIQYRNYALGPWVDVTDHEIRFVLNNANDIRPMEAMVRKMRKAQPKRKWRLIERIEEHLKVDGE